MDRSSGERSDGGQHPRGANIGAYAANGGVVNVGKAVGTVNNYRRAPKRRRHSAPSRRVDAGILTVLTEELHAVVEVLRRHQNYQSVQLFGGTEAHLAEVPAEGGNLQVLAVQTLDRGQRSAAMAFQRLRDEFNPPVVLLVGIAGGVRADLAVGDVVIADEVIYYDARRETPDGPRRRGQSQPMASVLRHRLNEFFRRYGQSIPLDPASATVRLYRGPIGSGDAVITDGDSDIVDWLRRFNEKTLAVETEAGGVGQAFYEQIDTEPSLKGWLTIRGISDLANRDKGHDDHQFAADGAAAVMDRLLPLLKLTEAP